MSTLDSVVKEAQHVQFNDTDFRTEYELPHDKEFLAQKIKWANEQIENFINENLKFHPNANRTVLKFIADFLYCHACNKYDPELLRLTFHAGYCYYFAKMLKTAFDRGNVCNTYPYGHWCWVDTDGIPYDIEGVCESEAQEYIPERYFGNLVNDFLHVEGKDVNATQEDILKVASRYDADKAREGAKW